MNPRWAVFLVGLTALTGASAPLAAQAKPQQQAMLNLNTATREQLLAFPGIGAAYADKIIEGRPFKMRSELVGRHIMPAANYLKIKKWLVPTAEDAAAEKAAEAEVGPPAPLHDSNGRLNVNVATREQLLAIKGIGAQYADKIIEARPFKTLNELVTRGVLPRTVYEDVRSRIFAQ